MKVLRTVLLILIAATFAVGGTARAMPLPATAAEPPCHEAPAQQDKSAPAQAAVNCCIGCMPAPGEAPVILGVTPAEPAAYAAVAHRSDGLTTSPEPDPPRLRA